MGEVASGRRAHVPRVRDRLSAALVDALAPDEVGRVVAGALEELTGRPGGHVMRPCLDGSHLHRHSLLSPSVETAEAVELALDDLREPWARAWHGDVASGRAGVLGLEDEVLWVPMGAEEDRWVLAAQIDPSADSQGLRADLRAIADEAWVALQRADLVSDLQDQLEILSAITAVAGGSIADVRASAERIARVAATTLGADVTVVHVVDADGRLQPVAGHGGDPGLGAGTAVAETLFTTGREVVAARRTDVVDPTGPWGEAGTHFLGLPLRLASRVVGMIVAARPAGASPYSSLTLQVGAAMAQQAALVLDHAQLLEGEQATANRLRELDQLKGDWVAGLTHDLKAPLTGLVGFTRTLLRHGDRLSEEDRTTYLQSMDKQATRLVDMVDDLLLSARMDDGHVAPTRQSTFDLADVVNEAVETFGPDVRARVLVAAAPGIRVRGDRSQLLRVVTNLVDNAGKYAEGDAPIEVCVTVEADTAHVIVDDHGRGIPEAERERVFERFRRGEAGRSSGSTGLGLYIGRGIARGHGGDLAAAESPAGGARMVLTMPLDRGGVLRAARDGAVA